MKSILEKKKLRLNKLKKVGGGSKHGRQDFAISAKRNFKELTMDHIVPLARFGTTTPGNVVPACRECNKNKGVDTPVDLILKKDMLE